MYEALFTTLTDQAVDYFEFGVWNGDSFKKIVSLNNHPGSRFYGFDTFEGLPEQWQNVDSGGYSAAGKIPSIDDPRTKFIKGLYQHTFQTFLKEYNGTGIKVVNLDSDLYSSNLFVLSSIYSILNVGDYIIFDEFGYKFAHEYRAFENFCSAFYPGLKLISIAGAFEQAAFKVIEKIVL